MTDHSRLYGIHCTNLIFFYISASGPLWCNLKCPLRALDRYADGQEICDYYYHYHKNRLKKTVMYPMSGTFVANQGSCLNLNGHSNM